MDQVLTTYHSDKILLFLALDFIRASMLNANFFSFSLLTFVFIV